MFGLKDKHFRIALMISAIIHTGFLYPLPLFKVNRQISKTKPKQLEILYCQTEQQPLPKVEEIREVESETTAINSTESAEILMPKKQSTGLINEDISSLAKVPSEVSISEEKEINKITEIKALSIKEIPIFLNYYQIIRNKIQRMTIYPCAAKQELIEGTTYLSFILLPNGRLKQIDIQKSSGHQLLDQSATWSVKRASPFPPFPRGLQQVYLRLNIQISYELN